MNESKMFQLIVMDHYSNPSQLTNLKPHHYYESHINPTDCNDDFYVYLDIKDDLINDVLFSGKGCAISTAALDILALNIIKKPLFEVKNFIIKYLDFITLGHNANDMNDLKIFQNVHKQLNRISCATLGARIILQGINNYESKI